MSNVEVKRVSQFFLVVIVIVILVIGLFARANASGARTTARFCQKFIDANLNEEFAVVEGNCSVLYHDVWVDVQSFDFLLPDLQED